MSNRTFVTYDRSTGEIVAVSNESEGHLAMRKARGEPIIEVPGPVDMKAYKVELSSLKVVPKEVD